MEEEEGMANMYDTPLSPPRVPDWRYVGPPGQPMAMQESMWGKSPYQSIV